MMKAFKIVCFVMMLAAAFAFAETATAQTIPTVTVDIVDVETAQPLRQRVSVTATEELVNENGEYQMYVSLSPIAFGGVYQVLKLQMSCEQEICVGSQETLSEMFWFNLQRHSHEQNWRATLTQGSLDEGWRFLPGSAYHSEDYTRGYRYMYFGYLAGNPLEVQVDGRPYSEAVTISVANGITPEFQVELGSVRDEDGNAVAEPHPDFNYEIRYIDDGECDEATDTCEPNVVFAFSAPAGTPVGWDIGLAVRAGFDNESGFERRSTDWEWVRTSPVKRYLPRISR